MVMIIAEAGVNHNGDRRLALELVDAAARAGADAVKFQTFRADALVSRGASKAEYQRRTTDAAESQLEMIRALELSPADHHALVEHCRRRGIAFLSTPFDIPSLHFLVDEVGLETLKLPSGEVTNAPLLLEAARRCRRIVLSTGMCTLDEVGEALGVLAFGWAAARDEAPSRSAFIRYFADPAVRAVLSGRVTLLHCTTEYPAPFEDVNLRAMDTLGAAFSLPIGYSDHTPGIAVAMAAAARGAVVIEKHFTLDRNLPGPDHRASLEPDELVAMVTGIRQISAALGSPDKKPAASEVKNMDIARKSLVAAAAITRGETFNAVNLTVKRPGGGVSPMEYWDWLGRPAGRDFDVDEMVS